MEKIFSFTSNAGYNYTGFFNLTTVSFCAVERSGFAGVATIYFMLILKNKFDLKNVLMMVLCVACTIFCSSSSAIVTTLIFLAILLTKEILKSKNGLLQICSLVSLCIVFSFVIINREYLFSKVNDYFNQTKEWGSAYFRSQANIYGIKAFKYSPLIGLGIGTNYSHSALIQVLSNIGVLGALFTLLFHLSFVKIKLNFENIIIIIALIGIYWNSGIIQSFTSPHLLFFFLCLSNTKYSMKFDCYSLKTNFN